MPIKNSPIETHKPRYDWFFYFERLQGYSCECGLVGPLSGDLEFGPRSMQENCFLLITYNGIERTTPFCLQVSCQRWLSKRHFTSFNSIKRRADIQTMELWEPWPYLEVWRWKLVSLSKWCYPARHFTLITVVKIFRVWQKIVPKPRMSLSMPGFCYLFPCSWVF